MLMAKHHCLSEGIWYRQTTYMSQVSYIAHLVVLYMPDSKGLVCVEVKV